MRPFYDFSVPEGYPKQLSASDSVFRNLPLTSLDGAIMREFLFKGDQVYHVNITTAKVNHKTNQCHPLKWVTNVCLNVKFKTGVCIELDSSLMTQSIMFLTFFLSLQVSGPYSLTLHFFRCSAVMSQALAGDVNTTTSFESDEIEVEEVLRPLQVLEDDLELENSSNSLNTAVPQNRPLNLLQPFSYYWFIL